MSGRTPEDHPSNGSSVVLVHGMGRTSISMAPLAFALSSRGYAPSRFGYPSRTVEIAAAGRSLADHVRRLVEGRSPSSVHLVGHSLGGILIRWLIAHERPPRLGRVVMLAPPNQGSSVADRIASGWASRFFRPLPDLTTRPSSMARNIPTPTDIEIGIIAGDRDNKVSVEETHLSGQKDHVVVASGHTFIMARPTVHRLVLRFLETGSFT